MNTFDGYIRRDGTNSKVLLDGGDAKALSSFIGTLSYNNNKITYTKADGSTSYNLVDLSNYIYNLNVATSDNLGGIKIGFLQSGKNYPVQLDSNNKAYVYVPWEENSHYTTRLYVGDGTAENKITTNGNTKITVTDNNNVRNYITLIGSGATNISSDDNGKITINSTNTTYNTGDSATLNKGTNTEGKLWSAKTLVDYISDILGVDSTAITSLNTLIGLLHDNDTATGILVELAKKLNTPSSSIGSNNQPIYWNGSSFTTIGYTIEKSVPSNAIFTDTKYSFYVGENNNIKEHKNVSNPYFKLFENNTPTSIQIKAGTGISVSSDTNGNITIKNESPDLNHNTWRPIKIEGTEKLGSATNTDALNLTAGNGIEVSYDSTNKKVIIKNTKPDLNHDTHYTTSMYIGENNDTKANKAVNSPYFKLFDNDIRRSTLRFVAGSGIGIVSDDSGNITITNSSPDQNHNTDKTGIKLGTILGTKKTDSTVIINNSSTGLTIAGGTNRFSIGDGTNYIEIPITPSFTVTNKDSKIGTSLTTIATIAGTDIKAKIDSYLPLSGGALNGYLTISGGSSHAPLIVKGGLIGYRHNIQLIPADNWSGILFGANDVTTEVSSTTTNSYWVGNNNGAFSIAKGGSGNAPISLYCNGTDWYVNTKKIYHTGNLPAYPTKESWNYDDRYLKLSTGGTVLGTTTFKTDSYGTQLEIYRNTNNGNPSIKFNNSNCIINRSIGFETSRNGNNAFYFTDNNATNKYYVASEEYVNNLYNALLNGYANSAGNADMVDNYHAFDIGKAGWAIVGGLNPKKYYKIATISLNGTWAATFIIDTSGDSNYCNYAHGKLTISCHTGASFSVTLLCGPDYNETIYAYIDSSFNVWLAHDNLYTGFLRWKCIFNNAGNNLTLYTSNITSQQTEPSSYKITSNGAYHYSKSTTTFYYNGGMYNNNNNASYPIIRNVNLLGNATNATNATYANYLNLVADNEIRFNKIPSSSINVHFNYVWAGGIADDKIIDYRFMNGNRGYAGIIAEQLSCTNGYIYLYGPGSGTYDLSSISSNSSGLTIETPRATNASNGTALPLMVKTRGGLWNTVQARGFSIMGFTNREGLFVGTGDGATFTSHNVKINTWYGFAIQNTCTGDDRLSTAAWVCNARNGDTSQQGNITITSSAWRTLNIIRGDYGTSSVGGIDANGAYFAHAKSESTTAYIYIKAGTGITTNYSYYANSDIRLKNILSNPSYSSEQFANLDLVKYTWKENPEIVHLGSISQSVETTFPELITENDKGYKSLDYATLGAIGVISLAREIVELKKEIKELKSKLYG